MITSAIARMNMFMHGIEEFQIVRGDTLANPAFLEHDQLKKFNVILANPPYSIKAWDQKSFANDPYGRNIWGVPPQGCADYAFQQHIQQSLDTKNGRSISLWPHGVLFRDKEAGMRQEMLQADVVECVIGIGANLFYNSPMEACLLVTNNNKPSSRRGKVLFINAVNEVKHETSVSRLEPNHIEKIFSSYHDGADVADFSRMVDLEEIENQQFNLSVNRYVTPQSSENHLDFEAAYDDWNASSVALQKQMNLILNQL